MSQIPKRKAAAVIATMLLIDDCDEKTVKKRIWFKQWFMDREKYSQINLLKELEHHLK